MYSNPQAPPGTPGLASPSLTIVLTTLLLIFFFIGLFSIYFCKCFMDGMMASLNFRRTASENAASLVGVTPVKNGLDPVLIELFPTFAYSEVKELRKEECALECAICLVEVADEDLLRLLTICHHCFHRECIDLWLESHKTCPVCRRDLDLPQEELMKTNNNANFQLPGVNIDHQDVENEHAIRIKINDDDEEPANEEEVDETRVKPWRSEVFSRSHTTGHSLAVGRTGDNDHDKYTLRLLPEHVPADGARGHRGATLSCIDFGPFDSSSTDPKTASRLASLSRSSNVVGDVEKLGV